MNIDPVTGDPSSSSTRKMTGWEYVWHCHLLGHEEYDMMRPFVVVVSPEPASGLTAQYTALDTVTLTWNDNSPQPAACVLNTRPPNTNPEDGFIIERLRRWRCGWRIYRVGKFINLAIARDPNTTGPISFVDPTAVQAGNPTYAYRVVAYNKGLADPSNVVQVNAVPPPAAPTSLNVTLQTGPQIRVRFNDNANNETGFIVQRSMNGGAFAQVNAPGPSNGTGGTVTWTDVAVLPGNSYSYQVAAVNAGGPSAWVTSGLVAVPTLPLAPSNFTGIAPGRATRKGSG
jgi:hypothetical protein